MIKQITTVEYACRSLPPELNDAIANKKVLVVCGKTTLQSSAVRKLVGSVNCAAIFSDFKPNPDFDSVIAAIRIFKSFRCEAILAIGGGSAIDVAKCVKFFLDADTSAPFPTTEPRENSILLAAIPTTAGTGSEATRFAVVYYCGEKQSVEHESILPSFAVLDAALLETLPHRQRSATAFDALCHAVESFLSVNSTLKSREYSLSAIALFLDNYTGYINNELKSNENMLFCANTAGRAINISKTTAAHAMSYKLTSLTGIPHGHAAALCLPTVLRHIDACSQPQHCSDKRGVDFLRDRLDELCNAFSRTSITECADFLEEIIIRCFGDVAVTFSVNDIDLLVNSVNPQRLANSPVSFDEAAIRRAYHEILSFCERNGG